MGARIVPDLLPLAQDTASLVHDPRNARTHNAKNLAAIKASLERFGQRKPLVVRRSDRRVLAGNGTLEAARALGWDRLACVMVDDDDPTAVAFGLADNRTAELAEWDEEQLAELVAELEAAGLEEGLGWTDREVKRFLDETAKGDAGEDAGPTEPPSDPVSVVGGVYRMGPHVLVCGDATDPEAWAKALEGRRAALCVTDPPYGVGLDCASADRRGDPTAEGAPMEWEDTQDNLVPLIAGFLPLAQANADVVMLTPGNLNQWLYPRPTWCLAWYLPVTVTSCAWGFASWQPILAYGGDPVLKAGRGRARDAWACTPGQLGEFAGKNRNVAGHPCPKPEDFWAWLMERGSVHAGDLVVDPFMGSGTTLITAAKLGKVSAGIELSPAYCDVIRRRWGTWARSCGQPVGDGL